MDAGFSRADAETESIYVKLDENLFGPEILPL
jgi:hypothetical protein